MDTALLWSRIYDVIIKAVLSVEDAILDTSKEMGVGCSSCFELLGFDILVDSCLKYDHFPTGRPWLLEVNLSPSLACDAPLDYYLKSNLVAETLSLACIHLCDGNHDFSLHEPKAPAQSQPPLEPGHRELFLRLKASVRD